VWGKGIALKTRERINRIFSCKVFISVVPLPNTLDKLNVQSTEVGKKDRKGNTAFAALYTHDRFPVASQEGGKLTLRVDATAIG